MVSNNSDWTSSLAFLVPELRILAIVLLSQSANCGVHYFALVLPFFALPSSLDSEIF